MESRSSYFLLYLKIHGQKTQSAKNIKTMIRRTEQMTAFVTFLAGMVTGGILLIIFSMMVTSEREDHRWEKEDWEEEE